MACRPDTPYSHQQLTGLLGEARLKLAKSTVYLTPASKAAINAAINLVDIVGNDLRDWPYKLEFPLMPR